MTLAGRGPGKGKEYFESLKQKKSAAANAKKKRLTPGDNADREYGPNAAVRYSHRNRKPPDRYDGIPDDHRTQPQYADLHAENRDKSPDTAAPATSGLSVASGDGDPRTQPHVDPANTAAHAATNTAGANPSTETAANSSECTTFSPFHSIFFGTT